MNGQSSESHGDAGAPIAVAGNDAERDSHAPAPLITDSQLLVDLDGFEGPIDVLDHASVAMGFGGKLGVDATRKWKEEGFTREWPEVLKMPPALIARVDDLWKELGL